MIQLRWYSEEILGGIPERYYFLPERLQYRVIQNPFEFGIQEPIWSDWIDVPAESDE